MVCGVDKHTIAIVTVRGIARSGDQMVRINRLFLGAAVLTQLNLNASLAASVPNMTTNEKSDLEMITVTGTRAKPRTALKSMSPIDTISAESVKTTASSEFVEMMAALVPSFSVQRLPALDGTIFVRPARLRNLSPDQTLVLVNGKRVHNSAMMMSPANGGVFQAPDLDQIASSAIKSVEVLRDGASAQYGSDAIAGVINLILDDSEGFSGFAQYGQYYEGDGKGPRVGGHGGWRSGNNFLSGTVEYSNTTETSRSQQVVFAAALQASNPNLNVPNPAVRWGQPEREATRLAFNAGADLAGISGYAFGTYGKGYGISDFNYRGPLGAIIQPGNIFSSGNASNFAPNAAFPGFTALQVYPVGFTPHFGQNDEDISIIAGAKKTLENGIFLDLSVNYGRNRIDYFMKNSFNFSLGPKSPTSFDDGAVEQVELMYNFDGSIPIKNNFTANPVSVAFGAEQRRQDFQIFAGDPASYAIGPGAPGLAVGSAGFPGYSPAQANKYNQTSRSGYIDIDVPFTDAWTVAMAGRYTTFDKYDNSTTYKISSRYEFTTNLALRGAVSTGFHAPTPAQLSSEALSQGLNPAIGIVTTGRFSPVGPVANFLKSSRGANIKPLTPETSDNYSLGLVWSGNSGFSSTLDAYRIDVADRLTASTSYTLTAAERTALDALKIPNVTGISSANFLQNGYNSSTRGVDFVTNYNHEVASGTLVHTAAISYVKTKISKVTQPFVGNTALVLGTPISILQNSLPALRATFSSTFKRDSWDVTARVRYYGSWLDSVNQGGFYIQKISPLVMADLSASYRVNSHLTTRIGAENIFNTYPDKAQFQAWRGLLYSRFSPYNTDGGYYYVRAEISY